MCIRDRHTVNRFLQDNPDCFDLVERVLFDTHTESVYEAEVDKLYDKDVYKRQYLDTLKVSDTPYSLVVSFYPQGVKAEIPEGSDKPSTATIKLTVNRCV